VHRFHLRSLGYLASLGLLAGALAACTGGNGTSPAPGAFPPLSPGGTPHAQYVVVANVITQSLLTYNLGTGSIPNSGNLSPAYNNHSGTIFQPFFIFNDFNSNLWAADFGASKVTWYSVSASGGTPASHTISGPNTTLGCPTGVYINPAGVIYVADPCSTHGVASIDVFAAGAVGNVAPSAWLGGGATTLSSPQGLSIDSSGDIWVIDANTLTVDEFASVALGSGQNTFAPTGAITSASFSVPLEIYIDYQKHIWVADLDGGASGYSEVMEFNPTFGLQTPICNIGGSNTNLTGGQISMAVDNGGYVYAVQNGYNGIDIFKAGHCGNVAPDYLIFGGSTALNGPSAILVYSTGNDY